MPLFLFCLSVFPYDLKKNYLKILITVDVQYYISQVYNTVIRHLYNLQSDTYLAPEYSASSDECVSVCSSPAPLKSKEGHDSPPKA